MITKTLATLILATGLTQGATLVGSLHATDTADPPLSQSITTTTRTTNGNLITRGAVEGDLNIMAGHELGTSSYDGINLRKFSLVTQYNELTRFASDTAGGLITWDFDLSSYLSGKTVGNATGNSQFSLDVIFSNRSSSAREGLWFISYNGDGLALDTTDITTHTVSGNTSGTENFNLVQTAANYGSILTLPANTASGTSSIDLTSQIATIASGDGKIRLAYVERDFRGDILINDVSGIVETIAIPEPSTGLLGLCSILFLFSRNRR